MHYSLMILAYLSSFSTTHCALTKQPSMATQTTTTTDHQVAVIAVPFLGQGHLNQLLQFSCLLSSYGFSVHYVAPPFFSRQAKSRANGLDPLLIQRINFHDIPTSHFESPPPDPHSPHKLPTQLHYACNASLSLRKPFSVFLLDLSKKFKRVVVIYDPMMAFTIQDVESVPNAESYVFNCSGAASLVSFFWCQLPKPISIEYPKELPFSKGFLMDGLNSFVALQIEHLARRSGDIYNTCRLIEAPYLNILTNEEVAGAKRKAWAVGPILPPVLSSQTSPHECLDWLEQHQPKSVIYISFGTTVSLPDEQIKEIAFGLERSGANFLWVLRDEDTGGVLSLSARQSGLPEGFEERVKGRGMVYREWAPQPQILAHGSTGGFVSHCGWNSSIECIAAGVPVATWPMHSDQPTNAAFLAQVLGMGIVVKEWAEHAEVVRSEVIEDAVRRLMGPGEGERVRRRAEEVGEMVRAAAKEGGASRIEMDSFIDHISRT